MPPVQENGPSVVLAHNPVRLADIEDQGRRALDKVHQLRGRILSPLSQKKPPIISSTELVELCGIGKHALTYRLSKEDLPAGTVSTGRRREFTLAEAQVWIREYRAASLRPAGAPACTVALGNFKGGSTKTTTSMTLAQGLSRRRPCRNSSAFCPTRRSATMRR
jgi:chromosome partitioning protein